LIYFVQNADELRRALRSRLLRLRGSNGLRCGGQGNGQDDEQQQVTNRVHADYDGTAVSAVSRRSGLWVQITISEAHAANLF
jgi:hypothetical protein